MLTSLPINVDDLERVPFDDRRALDATMADLREARIREFLHDIGSGLVREPDPHELYRKLRLCARVNGHEVPRNVGLLMFADDPERWFPGARIEVVQLGDAGGTVFDERVFRGPLHEQLRQALQYLQGLSTEHLRKRSDAPQAEGWASFPYRALRESLVNAVYHRSYEGNPEPIKVYLFADRMEITSYPGPVDGIRSEHLVPGCRVPSVPARNRRIGELLKELRLAEGRGTGVPSMYEDMRANGSPPPEFDFDEARSYFRVTLPAHPEYVVLDALRDATRLKMVGERSAAARRLEDAFWAQPRSAGLARASATRPRPCSIGWIRRRSRSRTWSTRRSRSAGSGAIATPTGRSHEWPSSSPATRGRSTSWPRPSWRSPASPAPTRDQTRAQTRAPPQGPRAPPRARSMPKPGGRSSRRRAPCSSECSSSGHPCPDTRGRGSTSGRRSRPSGLRARRPGRPMPRPRDAFPISTSSRKRSRGSASRRTTIRDPSRRKGC